MRKSTLLLIVFFFFSCGKQSAPPLELQDTESVQNSSEFERAKLPAPQEATFAAEESSTADMLEHGPAIDMNTDKNTVAEQQKNEIKIDPEVLFPDFAWEKYMVLPNDYLIKIAKKEYGDFRLWRNIYAWNKDNIGNNPNIIYPYNFLNIQKERISAKIAEPTYLAYTVKSGDNLWNISGEKYGDAKSWIILLWDNEETIKANAGILTPGMTLKLREKLDPNA